MLLVFTQETKKLYINENTAMVYIFLFNHADVHPGVVAYVPVAACMKSNSHIYTIIVHYNLQLAAVLVDVLGCMSYSSAGGSTQRP